MTPSIATVVRLLDILLGVRLTAKVASAATEDEVTRWMQGERMSIEQEARLRTAHQVSQVIAEREGPQVARAWMLGMNPQLDDENPILCIAADRHHDVLLAARAYLKGDTFG
jgi:hypothetical protein